MDLKVKSNAGAVAARLAAQAERARNPEPPMKVAAALLDTLIGDAFRASASPAGEAWAKLAPSTLLNRARPKGGSRSVSGKRRVSKSVVGAKPLLDTGVGRNSISVRARGNVITIRAGQKYMAYHLGGDRTRNPPRPPRRAWAPVLWDVARWSFDARGKGGAWLAALRKRVADYIQGGA